MGCQHNVLVDEQRNESLGGSELRNEGSVEAGEDDIFGFANSIEEVHRGNES